MQTYDPQKKTDDVRQGNERQTNLRVLLLSSAGIVLVFAIIYIVYTMMTGAPA